MTAVERRIQSSRPHADHAAADRVQTRLGEYRQNLYGGRGPGISEEEWLLNTSLRPCIGGVPTAASREELHLRTLRIRGQQVQAQLESTWARAQHAPTAENHDAERAANAAVRPGVSGLLAALLRRLLQVLRSPRSRVGISSASRRGSR